MNENETTAKSEEQAQQPVERKPLSEKIRKEVNRLIAVGKHRGSVTYD